MPPKSCVFCQIVNNEVNAAILYRDQQVVAFRDIHPVAPNHTLIIPTRHVASLSQLPGGDESVLDTMFAVTRKLVLQAGLDQSGYRLVINTGDDGGQTVYHLHMHLLGGRRMHWPPG